MKKSPFGDFFCFYMQLKFIDKIKKWQKIAESGNFLLKLPLLRPIT